MGMFFHDDSESSYGYDYDDSQISKFGAPDDPDPTETHHVSKFGASDEVHSEPKISKFGTSKTTRRKLS